MKMNGKLKLNIKKTDSATQQIEKKPKKIVKSERTSITKKN